MKREKILWLCIIVLGVLNAACLAFITLAPSRPPEGKIDRTIIESLRLDKNQIEKFNQLKEEHHRHMLEADRQMEKPFREYFGLLTGTRNQFKEDSLKNTLSALYQQKVQMTYEHFAEIKAMCSAEQQKGFKKIVPHLMNVISPPKRGPVRGK